MKGESYTKGPWKTDGHKVWGCGIEVASIFRPVVQDEIEMVLANARLIAAAPDLLAALQAMHKKLITEADWVSDDNEFNAIERNSMAAITKATKED